MWRSVLQRKATVNFNVREDEEVLVQSQKLLTVLQINRVYNFVWVYPKYKQGIAWSDLLNKIYLQKYCNVKFAPLQLPINGFKTRRRAETDKTEKSLGRGEILSTRKNKWLR